MRYLLIFVVLFLSYSVRSQSLWSPVVIGGGGYVIGLVAHPKQEGLTYIRTDVGGAYRSNGPNSWTPITDEMSTSNYFGGESIQLDPTDANVVYYAGGMYDYYSGCVFKSVNQGTNWTCTLPMKGGSNAANRFAGERIFVDLVNGSRVLYGSRFAGLYQSTNSAASWSSIASNIPLDQFSATGITDIFADPSSVQTSPYSITKILYLINFNDSIYTSNDGGDSWASIGGPKIALRGAVSPDGKFVYVSGAINASSGVSQYEVSTQKWTDITPNKTIVEAGYIYDAIAVHPSDPTMVIAATRWPNGARNPFFRSLDNGRTWAEISANFILNSTVPWWSKYSYQMAISSVTIDPFDPAHAWATDFSGTWTTYNFNDSSPLWTTIEKGHEELVVMCLSAPPTGNLQSGTADANGFNHVDLNAYPLNNRGQGDTTGLDYAALKPSFLVSAQSIRYESSGGGYYSVDSGGTWTAFGSQIGIAGKITVSANAQTIIWAPINKPLQVSNNNGATWVPAKGDVSDVILISTFGVTDIWNYWEPLYADRVDPSVIYCAKYGIFYRSNDGGFTWSNTSAVVYSHGYDVWGVRASSVAGDVWYWSQPANTLQHSTDYGDTWQNVTGVTSVYQIAFGKNRNDNGVSTLYIAGSINKGKYGVYRSEDVGQTWFEYNTFGLPTPLIQAIAADGNTFGQVYIGTGGRGIFYSAQDGVYVSSDMEHKIPIA